MADKITTAELLNKFLSQWEKWDVFIGKELKANYETTNSILDELEDIQERNGLVEDGEFYYNDSSVKTLLDIINDKATKHTQEFVIKELTLLLKTLKKDKDIIYLGELFEDKDYTRFRYSEWTKKYSKNETIVRLSHTIKEILETRAITGAMKNKLNASTTIFHLKNNYKWVDKQEIDNTNINLNLNKDMSDMSDSELDDLINKQNG